MENVRRAGDKASVCYKDICLNLYNKNAELINGVAIITVIIVGVLKIAEALES